MSDSPRATIVLIHGAWAGSWVWDDLVPLLEAHGYQVITPDLPGSSGTLGDPAQASLTRCVEHVLDSLQDAHGPLFLVGHSGGGAVATQVAQTIAERVAGVGFVAGMMLPSGVGFAELVQEAKQYDPSAAGITPYLEWSQNRQVSRVPPGAAVSIFFNDLSLEKARQAALRLGPQADGSRVLVPEWTKERFGKLPRLYIEARLDRSVTLTLQRTMQTLMPGAEVISLNAGHAPQVSRPDEVAEALSGFIEKQLG